MDALHDGIDFPFTGNGRPDAPLLRLLLRPHEVVAKSKWLKSLVVKFFDGRFVIDFGNEKLSFQLGERGNAAKSFGRREDFLPDTMAADDERHPFMEK